MVRFGAAAGILTAAGLSRSRSITLDSPVVTVGLRSSIRPTRSRRSRGQEEATSPGGSSVRDPRLSTWWKQPGGSATRPAGLNPPQPRAVRPIGPPEIGPSCLGNSGRLRSLTSLPDPALNACESEPHLLSKTDPGGLVNDRSRPLLPGQDGPSSGDPIVRRDRR